MQAVAAQYGAGGVGAVRDGNGRGALHFAAQVAQNELCTALLADHGVNVNAQDDHGAPPVADAAAAAVLALQATSRVIGAAACLLKPQALPRPLGPGR